MLSGRKYSVARLLGTILAYSGSGEVKLSLAKSSLIVGNISSVLVLGVLIFFFLRVDRVKVFVISTGFCLANSIFAYSLVNGTRSSRGVDRGGLNGFCSENGDLFFNGKCSTVCFDIAPIFSYSGSSVFFSV